MSFRLFLLGIACWLAGNTILVGDPAGPPPKNAPKPKRDFYGDPLPSGALVRLGSTRWRHSGPVFYVAFAAEGKELISAGLDGRLRVWEASSGKPLRQWTLNPDSKSTRWAQLPGSIVLSPDHKTLAVTVPDGTLHLWDVPSGKHIRQIGERDESRPRIYGGNGLAFAPDGKILAGRDHDHQIRVWDVSSGKMVREIAVTNLARGNVSFFGRIGNGLAFMSNGKELAAVNSMMNQDNQGEVVFWDVATGKKTRTIKGEAGSMSGRLAYSGKTLAIYWGDRSVALYDAGSGKMLHQLRGAEVDAAVLTLVFSRNGKQLVTRAAMQSPLIHVWDVAKAKEIRNMGRPVSNDNNNIFRNHTGAGGSCQTIALSPDGAILAEALPTGAIRLWEVATGKEIGGAMK